jgi:hypothetical protein
VRTLHRPDLFSWSIFDTARNIDFNGLAWARPEGTIVVDPVPLSEHDETHLGSLGDVAWIVVTNSDHVREAVALAARTGARIAGPAGEREVLSDVCDRWLDDGDEVVPGLRVITLHGSKTPGELALVLDDTTLITGDLVRAHRGGALTMLPFPKLADERAARDSVRRLAALPGIEAVLVGDGWPVFTDGAARLAEILGGLG